ncbi:Hpt domain-containing protein [[Limnothrix rosea] IAM M-220]|uniref:Hpt domain-containing protein n=1 Tax=[Limnothrix rosea] IAM M-220 TaxID=454133 RepID=UPI000961E707|nr:Hpt domain-containing protein [[Limnothrix rosea] IAM M-220]OKH13758.1 histidine kinase [[Limnothrix rosea] IAM M-220]
MDAASQQKILGYFIEEAKEHLETIEQGILDLGGAADDSEQMNELFRAAHSVKGGAAMLGYTSIQKTAHRLEDGFKIFKENKIPVDQQLESLFLSAYDILSALLDKLQSPYGLKDEDGKAMVKEAEPQFAELQSYLESLARGETPQPKASGSPATGTMGEQLRDYLRQMLAIFKQEATPENRQKLQKVCVALAKLDKETKAWQTILKAAHKAIANPAHSFNLLAPVVIKEIKTAGDHLDLGEPKKITLSPELKHLAIAKMPQILVPVDPSHAAKALSKAFSQKQIGQLVKILSSKK